ncbi:uncharacterized protein M421DRAFT_99174 [Didymella exigua CBS 183.55]|uniref:Uncharacterized protein n=1 Tax=Didymella exigua CBS 183.55 TaxID=1150837 RepID=A0A6A5RS85_9PLEO|nr:uncharacterized protein M421DRAFT_99174 [Didymella exigua CBS 183.55]KAF1931311.1 hypothetical protein M421DRAFT_99174 [Didymella exigua CBS 183.55]
MAQWLHSKQEEKIWTSGAPGEGVLVKKQKGSYAYSPVDLIEDGSGLYEAVNQLNARIHRTLRLQVIPSLIHLAHAQRHQSAAFVADTATLLVWEDEPTRLLERAEYIQDALMTMSWKPEPAEEGAEKDTKKPFIKIEEYEEQTGEEATEEAPRKIVMWQCIYEGATLALMFGCLGAGWRWIAIEHLTDPNWMRLLFILVLPAQAWLGLFFFQAIIGDLAQLFGPVGYMERNSKYYSGKAPRRLQRDTFGPLPHVTIQMPVYKEGLRAVIEPTVRSIKQAISTYELQGGTANIFVNDDGMQLISPEEAKARQDYYDENQIGWVARPKHNPKPAEGETEFLRRGKFKKASNMNYAMRLSVQVEEALAGMARHSQWNNNDESAAYNNALKQVLENREGEAWADGNIRMGDYILIIDSDTRVPNDCFLEAVSEMEQSPQVAILQYASGVMNVTNSFFENGITFFTNLVYTMIRFAVANGDVAPFVGHNAILRWSALQNIGYECEQDGWEKWWSESTVSEDFDMALRLQAEGYIVRLGAYKDGGYQEGVSLTVYDELARWEKYAYGCNELIFHPFKDWIFKGPFTKLFRTFVMSNMPLHSKLTIMAYIGTYYALGSSWILTLMNYVIIGLYNGHLDHYYLDSFKIYFSIVIVFTAVGNVALAVLRYRIGECGLLRALFTNLKWIPLLTIFLGGVSLHVSQALLCHFFSIDMQWGATSKEVEDISFWTAGLDVLKKFKYMLTFCVAIAAGMICMAFVVPETWQIRSLIACFPMGLVITNHVLLPTVLNPQLMTFTW